MAKKPLDLEILFVPDPVKDGVVALGDVYVGKPDLDPEVLADRVEVTVIQENGTEVVIDPTAQPLKTGAGGVLMYQGSAVTVLVDGEYSLKVNDSLGQQVYYVPSQGRETPISLTADRIPNGSFEAITGNVPDNWTLTQSGTGTVASDTAQSGNGLASLGFTSVDVNGGGEALCDPFDVSTGRGIDVHYMLQSTGATTRNMVEIDWKNSVGGLISTEIIADHVADNPLTWKNFTATTQKAPVDAVQAQIRLKGMAVGGVSMIGDSQFDGLTVRNESEPPVGAIVMYNGLFADIPANWQLCDGTAPTPNLTDKFIYGTNVEGELGDVGGTADTPLLTHTHDKGTMEIVGDISNVVRNQSAAPVANGAFSYVGSSVDSDGGEVRSGFTLAFKASDSWTGDTGEAGTTDGLATNIPPYLKLAFIQRIS